MLWRQPLKTLIVLSLVATGVGAGAQPPVTDPKKVHALVKKDQATLLDLREQDEVSEEGLAQGALWLPYSVAIARREGWLALIKSTKKDQVVYLSSSQTESTLRIKAQLEAEGFTKVLSAGTFADWKKKGLPIIRFKQTGKPLDRGHD